MPLKLIIIFFFLIASRFAIAQPIVVLDAGHGGKSPGAVSGKIYEKDINLNISLQIERHIKQIDPAIKVMQTRRDDKDMSLYQRADLANNNKANLFVSIHTNANPSQSASGMETYVMGVDKSGENLSVAMRENSVITMEDDYQKQYEGYDPKSPESFIIFSLMQYAYLDQSLKLAESVQNHYIKNCLLTSRGVKQEGFLVLWRTTMPSILTEVGFISNEKDRKYITSAKGQNEISLSIANAIVDFLKQNHNYKPIFEKNIEKVEATPIQTIPVTNKIIPENKTGNTIKTSNDGKIFYTVQVKMSDKQININSDNFGRWVSVVKEFNVNKLYKYTIGEVFSYKDALTLQMKLKEKFNDCFVVAHNADRRITLKEALQILGK